MEIANYSDVTKPLAARIFVESGAFKVFCEDALTRYKQAVLILDATEAQTLKAKQDYRIALSILDELQIAIRALCESDEQARIFNVHMDS